MVSFAFICSFRLHSFELGTGHLGIIPKTSLKDMRPFPTMVSFIACTATCGKYFEAMEKCVYFVVSKFCVEVRDTVQKLLEGYVLPYQKIRNELHLNMSVSFIKLI